ncbi:putative C-type lectin domain family 20 member A [Sardina pilchardus]|uniref:putative C-type lectin domain family 20 member A n=1 Tax=Sardina pilchardus TaxID=27697 RepID=UPI002E0D76FE
MMLILFITGALVGYSSQYQYRFVSDRMNWTEAQSYCRGTYTDLAIVCSEEDVNRMTATLPQDFTGAAWIGLEKGEVQRWQWSFAEKVFYTDDDLNFRNWRSGHPTTSMEDRCAVFEPDGQWFDDSCNTQRRFVCFNETAVGNMRYVLIEENKTWREAQMICREQYTDLVSVRDATENEALRAEANSQVWIGLFSDPWVWSDQANNSFRFWEPIQPNYFNNIQDCVVTRFSETRQLYQWNDIKCDVNRAFFCYSDVDEEITPTVTSDPLIATTYSTGSADQSINPAHTHHTSYNTANTHTHVATISGSTSSTSTEITTATTHSTEHTSTMSNTQTTHNTESVTSTGITHSTDSSTTDDTQTQYTIGASTNTTHHTAPVTTTGTKHSTDNTTTDNIHTQYTSEASTNATHHTDSTTATSHPEFTQTDYTGQTHSTTVTEHTLPQIITATSNTIQTTTSEEEITEQTTAYQLTEQTSSGQTLISSLFEDTLILIRENMSWIEALTYCKTHHLGLVSVTDEHTQQAVAEMAVNASTPHVWLGLHYTCKFSFWFWTGSDSVCYQNWAPGHGPGGQRECGLSGAVESSRGNQWVSLPGTQELQFICHTRGN